MLFFVSEECFRFLVPFAVSRSVTEMTVLHIFKRRMGLTKRGGYENETLSISSVVVQQTDKFTWSESSDFVQLVIPTVAIQNSRVSVAVC